MSSARAYYKTRGEPLEALCPSRPVHCSQFSITVDRRPLRHAPGALVRSPDDRFDKSGHEAPHISQFSHVLQHPDEKCLDGFVVVTAVPDRKNIAFRKEVFPFEQYVRLLGMLKEGVVFRHC
jgi:hypothetical protein